MPTQFYISVHDYFSWQRYEKLKKDDDLGVNFTYLESPLHVIHNYAPWHRKIIYNKHTLKFQMLRAIRQNKIELVQQIIDYKFQDDQKAFQIDEYVDPHLGYNSLQIASILNRTAIVEYLVFRGADINCTNSYQEKDKGFLGRQNDKTALMLATGYWQYETIRFLAEKVQADLSIKDQYGYTVIDQARLKGFNAIYQYLQKLQDQKDKQKRKKEGEEIVNFKKIEIDVKLDCETKFRDGIHFQLIDGLEYLGGVQTYPFKNFRQEYLINIQDRIKYKQE